MEGSWMSDSHPVQAVHLQLKCIVTATASSYMYIIRTLILLVAFQSGTFGLSQELLVRGQTCGIVNCPIL